MVISTSNWGVMLWSVQGKKKHGIKYFTMDAKPGAKPWKHAVGTKLDGWKVTEVEAVPPSVLKGRWPAGMGCPTGVVLQTTKAPCDLLQHAAAHAFRHMTVANLKLLVD